MATPFNRFDEDDDVLMMNPSRGGAEFDDEGSGATSGYGDADEDDLANDLDDEPLDDDADEDLRDDMDEDDI